MRMDLRITLGGFIALAALQFATMGWLRADIGSLDDRLNDGLARVDARLARVEARLTGVETRLDGVETRLADLEQGQVELAAKQSELGERMARFEGTLSTVVALYDRAPPEESARRDDGAAPEQGG